MRILIPFLFCVASTAFAVFDVEQVKQEITAELSLHLQGSSQSHPMLILIGGYPGAGKTTLINALAPMHDLAVILNNPPKEWYGTFQVLAKQSNLEENVNTPSAKAEGFSLV